MILKIYGRRRATKGTVIEQTKVINVQPSFFEPVKIKQGKKSVTLTSSDKSDQLGMDYFGRNYVGHELERDGKIISTTLENRELKKPVDNQGLGEKKHRGSVLTFRLIAET